MASKRQIKKNQRKQKEKKLKQAGYSQKQINKLSYSKIKQTYDTIITREKSENQRKKSEKKYQKAQDLLHYKRESLRALGFEDSQLKTTYLRKVKKSDIEAYKRGNDYALSIEKYPFLYEAGHFDFNKVYNFPDGKGLYIAWLDFTGESELSELMRRFQNYSNETLINFLEGIVNTPKTGHYNKGKLEGSSGRAGTFRSMLTNDKVAQKMLDNDNASIDKSLENREKRRLHTGINRHYQNISENGAPTIKSMTGRECLIILNAIMYNITEDSRDMYKGIYNSITYAIPEFKKFLPTP